MRRSSSILWAGLPTVVATLVVGLALPGIGGAGAFVTGALPGKATGSVVGGPGGPPSFIAAEYMSPTTPYAGPTPQARCDPGSRPERIQGKAPKADYESGRAIKGYFCNARMLFQFGLSGGYRVERYVDKAGHECAFWDSTVLWPHNAHTQRQGPGLYVMDMHDPRHPVHTDTLRTPAMQSPHESVRVNVRRGLLVADMGYPTWNPGFVDVYDVSEDCRHPVLLSSTPMGILGHEGGFAPDGKTFYVASLYAHTLAAVDLTNPEVPMLIWATDDYQPHGISISNDGNTLYMAEAAYRAETNEFTGLTILDVSEVQARVPNPTVKIVSRLTWPRMSTPQNATPFTVDGHKYLLETDEFGEGQNIGGARIIDIQNERKPFVVSNMRLAVNRGAETEDPGDNLPYQGYQGHYCTLPSRIDPYIVACTFIMSGLRVFDIRDPEHPREVAYFNDPLVPGEDPAYPVKAGAFAMSAPAYDQATRDIWYTDGHTGFHVVRLTKASGVTKFARRVVNPGN